MRNLTDPDIETHRDRSPRVMQHYGSWGDQQFGVFSVPVRLNGHTTLMRVIATSGDGWDHVSVSLLTRCPKWEEMEIVKRLFFKPDEVAMQLHVTVENHVNVHPFCLHLWRPHDLPIPLPPRLMV